MYSITETSPSIIDDLLVKQRAYFNKGHTVSYSFRIAQLKALKASIASNNEAILAALKTDLGKSAEEAYLTEISMVMNELDYHIKHLKSWTKATSVRTPLFVKPSQSYTQFQPLGLVLITAPWNYPFQLLINPLIGAISAGCVAMIKPAPEAPATAQILEHIIQACFDAAYISIIQGGKSTNTHLWNHEAFDLIFFTGSTQVGNVVYEAAAKHLTPVILELGGKSPTIVHKDAHIDIAAKRIVWGKFINAGQTCIAPDYVLAHENIMEKLLRRMRHYIVEMYGSDPKESPFYPRIINEKAIERLLTYLTAGTIYHGGEYEIKERYIAPTLLTNVPIDATVMQDEIFGPILPVIPYGDISEALCYINQQSLPLALYAFGNTTTCELIQQQTRSGGICINDTLMHVSNHHLPFGGVGNSGIGKYHGKYSFEAFSHQRAIVRTPTWIDLPFKYVPFKQFKWLKKFM